MNARRRPPLSCSATRSGSSSSAGARTSSARPSSSERPRRPLSASCPRGSRSRSTIGFGCRFSYGPRLRAARRPEHSRVWTRRPGRDAGAGQRRAEHDRRARGQASPRTHERLRPRVLAYGGESPGDQTWLEFAIQHLPALLVLAVACMNVGTLIYARTATREAEIAMRYALGAGRARIVAQLFVEALVLASIAAAVGLASADLLLRWGTGLYYAGLPGRRAVLGQSRTEVHDDRVRGGDDRRRRHHPGRAAGAEGDVGARAHPAAHPGRRWLDAAIRRVLDRRDDRAGGDHGHLSCRRPTASRKRRCAIGRSAIDFPTERYLAVRVS